MNNQRFISFAKSKVQQWLVNNVEGIDSISTNDIFVVWYCKTLQNHKVLLGTHFNDHYYSDIFWLSYFPSTSSNSNTSAF